MSFIPYKNINQYNQSFTNIYYDNCALKKKELENIEHFNYTTDINYGISNNACFENISPFMHTPTHAPIPNIVDTESELFGQTRKLTKSCPNESYPLKKTITGCENYDKGYPCNCNYCMNIKHDMNMKLCNKFLVPEYTRTNQPCNVLSGININRFDTLCDDVQNIQTIQDNSYIGVNTRLAVRDAWNTPVRYKKSSINYTV